MWTKTIRFAAFEVDFEQRELRKSGARVPLQHKPFRILELLLRQPGSLVTRQELAKELWPGLHVNFEHSLNSAMNTLRQVLGDSPRESRFIETRSGLGYRFIARIEESTGSARPTSPSTNSGAHHDYLRGRFFLNKMTSTSLQRAIGCFQSALKEDANCTLALTGLADAYSQLLLSGTVSSSDVCHTAREFASAALRAEPNLPEAHVAIGRLRMILDWDWHGAAEAFDRATALDPALPEAYRARALLLSALNRHDEALREIRHAHTIDPLSLPIGYELAWLLYLSRHFPEAAAQSWTVLSLDPGFFPAQNILGLTYRQLGSHDEAITEFENACACSDRHPSALAALGHAYATVGATSQAQQTLAELTEISQRHHVSPYYLALIHLGLGQLRSALEALQNACSQRDPLLLWLNADPRFASLRSEPDFMTLLRRTHGLSAHKAATALD
jgi:DNA-binding winged helix-turn-helix (wHTH) protein/Flp pilus assembly protein TadD